MICFVLLPKCEFFCKLIKVILNWWDSCEKTPALCTVSALYNLRSCAVVARHPIQSQNGTVCSKRTVCVGQLTCMARENRKSKCCGPWFVMHNR